MKEKILDINDLAGNRVELHLQTFINGDFKQMTLKEIIDQASEQNCKTIALTDLNKVHDDAQVSSLQSELKCDNLKVVHGAEFLYCIEDNAEPFKMTLLAKNKDGYAELKNIEASLHQTGMHRIIDINIFRENRKNLLCGSCGDTGELFKAIKDNRPVDEIEKIAVMYDYFEIFPTCDNDENSDVYRKIYELGDELGVPVISSFNYNYIYSKLDVTKKSYSTEKHENFGLTRISFDRMPKILSMLNYLGQAAAYRVAVANVNLINDMF